MTDVAGYTARRTDRDRIPPRRVLTGALMGDPVADRAERDRQARIRLGIADAASAPTSAATLAVLRALAGGNLNSKDLREAMDVTKTASERRTLEAQSLGYVTREGRGNNTVWRLAPAGREALEAQPQ